MNKSLLLLLFSIGTSWAQSPSTALLDKVSKQMASKENISLEFNYALFNAEAKINQETAGKVYIKGDKYHFEYLGVIQINDTKKTYTIVPDNEEVTIVDNKNAIDEMNPAKILSFYKEGYRFTWDIPQNVGGRKIQYIKLNPIDSTSDIASILLGIDTLKNEVFKVIETGKNGTKTTITISQYKSNSTLDPALFIFDEKIYIQLGFYIIKE
ncbi:MAG: outer membrane lipoprotein carrier protein LolA [Flavobacteriaceae bacterium]